MALMLTSLFPSYATTTVKMKENKNRIVTSTIHPLQRERGKASPEDMNNVIDKASHEVSHLFTVGFNNIAQTMEWGVKKTLS